MLVSKNSIGGEIVKDNETYTLEDNNALDHLTLSKTTLKPGMSTRGHSHEDQEEVYFFERGRATMIVGEESHAVIPGSIVLIPKGHFHRVINMSSTDDCEFVCVFEKYNRKGDAAIYNSN